MFSLSTTYDQQQQNFLNVNPAELNSPYKLSLYIRHLPQHHKKVLEKNLSDQQHRNDIAICSILSAFVSAHQLTPKFFFYNFNKRDFNDMMKKVLDASAIRLNNINYDWIWDIIQHVRSHSMNIKFKFDLYRYLNAIQMHDKSQIRQNWGKHFKSSSFELIWLYFIDNNIDKMSIIKLRKLCQEYAPNEFPGKILVETAMNGNLHHIT
eukprot:162028_1